MGKRKRRSKTTPESGETSSKKSRKSKTTIVLKKKKKNWSADLDKRFKIMTGAVEDVIEKKMTIRKAAEKWGVKRSTLADRVSGRVELGRRSGPPTILTRAEEQMLTEWIISLARRGFAFNKHKLLRTVKKILDKDKRTTMLKKKKNMPGNKWYRQFVKRNPRVKLVTDNPKMDQLEKVATSDTGYEDLESMLSGCESDSGSESESELESEVDSESESETEIETEVESPTVQMNRPNPIEVKLDVIIESEVGSDQEPRPELLLQQHPDTKTDLETQPVMLLDPSNPQEDFSGDPNSSPVISVGITVTITTSE